MNYDRKLAKYARQLENPKYYERILKILEKADKANYTFKDFTNADLEHITSEICSYFDAITTQEEHKKMIAHTNKNWFVISDKNLILWETDNLINALLYLIKGYFLLITTRFRQFFRPDLIITIQNVNWDISLCRGALRTATKIGCSFWNLEDKRIY